MDELEAVEEANLILRDGRPFQSMDGTLNFVYVDIEVLRALLARATRSHD